MDNIQWALNFRKGWDRHFGKFDKSIQEKILKKFERMKQPLQARGLHSSRYKIEETGQYRIAYIENQNTHTKDIYFVGDHKQYEKWYKEEV